MSAAQQLSRLPSRPQSPRAELAHVLRRRQGLVPADGLILLARAGGLTDAEILRLIRSWEERPWPRR